jgi:type IV pilus assembly protein PilW
VTSAAIDLRGRVTRHARGHAARGLTLVEVMIGLVIGMLVCLAAFSSARVFFASQRQAVGVGASSANAASALAAIKNDIANGGLGFFGDTAYLCAKLNLGLDHKPVADGVDFAPVMATRDGANDVLDVVYGNQVAAGATVRLASASNGTQASLKTLLPVSAGQAVLIAPASTGQPCTVRSVTASTPPTVDARQQLSFGAGGKHNQASFGEQPVYGENARVSLLGQLQWRRYAVEGTDLKLTHVIDGSSAVLLRHVIGLRVEYGTAAAAPGSSTLEGWREPVEAGWQTLDADNIGRVRALRVGVVVRSPQPEKPDASGNCTASTEKPQLFGNTIEPDVADWQCYRYRSVVVVAPMRNILYGMRS